MPEFQKVFFRLGNDVRNSVTLRFRLDETPFQRQVVMVLELFDEPALLTVFQAFRTRIIDQCHGFGPLDHPVEIVRPDGVLEFICWKIEPFTKLRRYEGGTDAPSGEHSLVAGEYYQMLEIQGSCLKRPHDLESLERFAVERNGQGTEQLRQQPGISERKNLQFLGLQLVDC